VTDRLASIVGTDDFIGLRGGVPYLVASSVIATYTGGAPAATEPAAFTAGQWTAAATATAGDISFNLTALPADGGSAITALQYRVGTGAAIAFAGTGTGVRVVTAGLSAGVAADLQVRAVNAIGAGAWSDIKNRTPLAGGGGGTTFIRFTTLTGGMVEGGNGTIGWDYTGTATDSGAASPDYTIASGVAGGVIVQFDTLAADPMLGFHSAATGGWNDDVHLLVYESGGAYFVQNAAFADFIITARTREAGDLVRAQFAADNTFTVDIARAAAPTTWLALGGGTITRPATLHPRLTSFGGSGAVFTAPRVA
jgi:hypothetical protein